MIRKILHKPQALLGLAMMLIVFFVVAFAPFIAPGFPVISSCASRPCRHSPRLLLLLL